MTIRTADSHDAAAIASVQVSSWKTTYRGIVPDAFLDSMNADERTSRWQELIASTEATFFVSEDEAGIFGFATGGKIRQPITGYDAELYAIYLLQERQGQGAGRALFRSLASALLSKGLTGMTVWVLEQNPAVGFYRRVGGVEVGRQKIEIGGVQLDEVAFGWGSLKECCDETL
jgi:GNAT superfamily N-acetyltransferase